MKAQLIIPPSGSWPEGVLYFSERGLYPFQADHIAQTYLDMQSGELSARMVSWDTGMGKGHFVMQTAALSFEDGVSDLLLLICEKNKLREWQADFREFTLLTPRMHHGPTRKKWLVKNGLPDVLITTYETGKADLATIDKSGRRKVFKDGPLLEQIMASGRKPMVVFDEMDRLSNRSAANYRAYEHMLKVLRKRFKNLPTIGLTATSVRKDYEDTFNQLRLLSPSSMPLIKDFESYFVRGRDIYGKARYFDHRVEEFTALCKPLMLVKRKSDPDVIDQFPKMTEEALRVDLEGDQKRLYDLVAGLGDTGGQLQALRQICAHPASLVHSATEGSSKLARVLVEEFGEDWIRQCSSAKTDALVAYVEPIVKRQEDKVVVFSFFGPSVLPLLRKALEARHIRCWSFAEPGELEVFKTAPGGGVLLCSDAAARGINLPEASYLVEYDMASTYGLRTQRLNRISRIGSGGPVATVRSMLANGTVEIGLCFSMLRGNAQSDKLLGEGEDGSAFMTAAMRRQILMEGS